MGIHKTSALSFSAILVVALAASFDPQAGTVKNNADTPSASATPSSPEAAYPTKDPYSPVVTDYMARPLAKITPEEKIELQNMEIQTEDTLNNIVSLSDNPAGANFINSFDKTNDPAEAAALIDANRDYIDRVNELMTLSDSSSQTASPMSKKGITDPKTAKELAVIVEHIVFSSAIKNQMKDTKNYQLAVVPGSFRTENGKTIIPRDSIYIEDENYGVVDFVRLHGDISVEQNGKVLNFDNYRKGATKQAPLETNWVTDAELFNEFDKSRYAYTSPEKYAEYLNENFKFGGRFTAVPILGMDYIHMDHPGSLLNKTTEVFYRFDKPKI